MRFSFVPLVLLIFCASAQTNPPAGSEIVTITPDTVVATINGKDFTAGDLERLTRNLDPTMRSLASQQPKAFLEQYAYTLNLAAEAEKAKLHESFPYRERLADARNQILAHAIVERRNAEAAVTPEEVKKQYEANRALYKQVAAKVIFISRMAQIANLGDGKVKNSSPEEIKAKVDAVTKKAKDGADFVKLAAEYSDDRNSAEKNADLPYPVRANSTNVPQDMRDALLGAAKGAIVGPLEHNTGYYLFRVESIELPAFDMVKADIEKELKAAIVKRWMDEVKSKSKVTLDNEPFWRTFIAANKPPEGGDKPEAGNTPAPKPGPGGSGGR